ncbi:MAG: hypothetical protein ACLGGV_00525 [Bacteroidia bacterium]
MYHYLFILELIVSELCVFKGGEQRVIKTENIMLNFSADKG